MAIIDTSAATRSDEDVLRVVGHADDFMRNHLTNRKNQIVVPLRDQLIDLSWPGTIVKAFGDIVYKISVDIS